MAHQYRAVRQWKTEGHRTGLWDHIGTVAQSLNKNGGAMQKMASLPPFDLGGFQKTEEPLIALWSAIQEESNRPIVVDLYPHFGAKDTGLHI